MFEWIISSIVLILVIIGLRYILKGKMNLLLQYALWGLVLVRLLVPVSFGGSAVSVMNAVPNDVPSAILSLGEPEGSLPEGNTPALAAPSTPPDTKPVPNAAYDGVTEVTPKAIDWGQIAGTVWVGGIVAVALCLVASNLHFALKLKRTRRSLHIPGCDLPVYVTDAIETPCLQGLIRPTIYVTPEATKKESILWHVLEHEATHYRHGDHIWSILRGVCLAVHWYNPLVWCAALLSRRDSELACDESTIRRIGEQERADYARTLIGMTCQKRAALFLTATTMTGSKSSIKERIILISKKPKMAIFTLVAVLLIAVLAVGCTFTGAKDNVNSDAAVIYDCGGLHVAIPNEYIDQLIVQTGDEIDMDHALISVYEKKSVESAAADGIDSPGLGYLFSFVRFDRMQYEQFLCSDGSGLSFFAKDDDWYYGYVQATDVRYYRSGDVYMDKAERAAWDTLHDEMGPSVRDDFIVRNDLTTYSDDDARLEYTYGGEHQLLNYYPDYSVNGSKDEVYTLVLSQPATQGDGGIWCVERMLGDDDSISLWFPDSGMPAAEYYAEIQAAHDAGERIDHADVYSAATSFLDESGYFSSAVIDGSLEPTLHLPDDLYTQD